MGQPSHGVTDVISVWVVEDHRETRETIKELIDSEPGLICTKAFGSAEEILAYIKDHYVPEVIICDVGLPGMSGIELVERLRPIASGTKVVMMTVHEEKEKIHSALTAGASGYLTKPPSADELIGAIRDVMNGGAAMSPRVARKVLEIFAQQHVSPYNYQLTAREQDVLEELVAGKTKKRIARDLSLSVCTVDTHLRSVYAKLHVNTQTAAVAKAFREGLVR
ncbi:MAG: response regulator transcription factor [Gemmatimonadetes bacterium]|nr:response regulator transcription factor [Gemmatimonadota bacterium]